MPYRISVTPKTGGDRQYVFGLRNGAALEKIAENIRKDGLLIGRVEPDGDFYVEKLDGKILP